MVPAASRPTGTIGMIKEALQPNIVLVSTKPVPAGKGMR
jgi:hypothetical protein